MVKSFKELTGRAEALGWTVCDHRDSEYGGYVELYKYSPAGEDFSFTAYGDTIEKLVRDVQEYAADFDVDEHVDLWADNRGIGGCPGTFRELVRDAEAIQEMLDELALEISSGRKLIPEYILRKLRQRKGLLSDDTSMDAVFNNLPPDEIFSEVCEWEGLCGYALTIRRWIKDIFDVELN